MRNLFHVLIISSCFLAWAPSVSSATSPVAKVLSAEERRSAQKRVAYIERKNEMERQSAGAKRIEWGEEWGFVYAVVLKNNLPVYVSRSFGESVTIYYDRDGQPELLQRYVGYNGSSWDKEDLLFLGKEIVSLKVRVDQENCIYQSSDCHTSTHYPNQEPPPELDEAARAILLAKTK